MKYKSNNNVVYSCKYHVVFCPKYRRSVLVDGVDVRLKELIIETFLFHNCWWCSIINHQTIYSEPEGCIINAIIRNSKTLSN